MRLTVLLLLLTVCWQALAQPIADKRRFLMTAGTPSSAFSIANTPGLVLYFTSDINVTNSSNVSPPAENDTVKRWGNQINITGIAGGSDNGDVQTNSGFASHAPHYHTNGPNALPFISFTNNASPTMLQCSPNQPTFHWPDTWFLVMHTAHSGATPQIVIGSVNSTTYEASYLNGSFAYTTTSDGGSTITSFTTPTSWFLATVLFKSGANSTLIRSNGVQITAGTLTAGNAATVWGNMGCQFDQTLPSQADIAAFVYATNDLNNFGSVGPYWMTNVENTLMTKYGISH